MNRRKFLSTLLAAPMVAAVEIYYPEPSYVRFDLQTFYEVKHIFAFDVWVDVLGVLASRNPSEGSLDMFQ